MKTEVGKTPLIKIPNNIFKFDGNGNSLCVKDESTNPTGSIKDRMIHYILSEATRTGELNKNQIVVAASSGNTGTSLAYMCRKFGYKCLVITNTKCSVEKQNNIRMYGADLTVLKSGGLPGTTDHYQWYADELCANNDNYYNIAQYTNKLNVQAYIDTLGREIWQETDGKVTHFIATGSTCGTISGVGRYLKSKNPDVKIYIADPIGSVIYDYYFGNEMVPGKYFIEGAGKDSTPALLEKDIIDGVIRVSDNDSIKTCHRLKKELNLYWGGSSGLNVFAAIELIKSFKGTNTQVVVTVAPDNGSRYESKIYNYGWLADNGINI